VIHSTSTGPYSASNKNSKLREEERLWSEKKRQRGISFPSAIKQKYLLIVRLDLKPSATGDIKLVRQGLRKLCGFFERIDVGEVKIDIKGESGDIVPSKMSDFDFSATVGFGIGFFEKMKIDRKYCPRRLYEMPLHVDLGDPAQYLFTQTDIILQLCSMMDFVNRWVFKTGSYPITPSEEWRYQAGPRKQNVEEKIHDISTAVSEWAIVSDVHSGFQRLDGRNLMGFMDGTSQPERLRNDVIWTTGNDEIGALIDGTYMVFQKIEHDLEQWEKLGVREQERWVGRSKGTGLLLGTLSREEDEKLAKDCRSCDPIVSKAARSRLKKLLEEQEDPSRPFYSSSDPRHKNIRLECPVWSHVRKANPRGEDGEAKRIIFRRGYLFMEDTIHPGRKLSSGLLFICFQRDIKNGFEYIKKHYLNNKNFPVPDVRKNFSREELAYRHMHGRFSEDELRKIGPYQRSILGLDSVEYASELQEAKDPDLQNTGKEGLTGPSQLGIYPRGDIVATVSLGGGYYFIPPIPNKKISEIGQQFFT
jgi:Dyp-type peroxidase family